MDQAQATPKAAAGEKETVLVDASFEPLMPQFLTNRKRDVVTMRETLAQQDFETVQKVAHGMKGAGGSYGFDRITELAAGIEQAARAGDVSTIARDLSTLDSYLNRVKVVYE